VDTSPRAGCCEVAEGYRGGNLLGAGRLRVKWAVRGCCGSNLRLLWREPVGSKGSRLNRHPGALTRVASAAVAVKGLRFASMNALESGAPLTAILAAAVLQL
jgi:hypothetical protein